MVPLLPFHMKQLMNVRNIKSSFSDENNYPPPPKLNIVLCLQRGTVLHCMQHFYTNIFRVEIPFGK
jgi:hypothetical protein